MKTPTMQRTLALCGAALLLASAACERSGEAAGADGATRAARGNYTFAGGPSGGTFQYYASAIATLGGRAPEVNARVLARATEGSVENVRLVNSGDADIGVVYSGHVYSARHGLLEQDDRRYENVMAVAYLYGAPAQLVVRRSSGITDPRQLAGKRVALGNAGSGAAYNAEVFFKALGIFDQLRTEYLGYRNAAEAFGNRQLDAYWVFAGFPAAAVMESALQNDVRLLDLYDAAEQVGLFRDYPYFTEVVIPAGTYQGQSADVRTFQDATIWVANANVPEDVVYNLLRTVFSDEGLEHMVTVHESATEMSIENGTRGIVTPFHPGAVRFWNEHGVQMAEERRPGS